MEPLIIRRTKIMRAGLNKRAVRKCLKMQEQGFSWEQIAAELTAPIELVKKFTPETMAEVEGRQKRAIEAATKRRVKNQEAADVLTESLKRTISDGTAPDEEDFA